MVIMVIMVIREEELGRAAVRLQQFGRGQFSSCHASPPSLYELPPKCQPSLNQESRNIHNIHLLGYIFCLYWRAKSNTLYRDIITGIFFFRMSCKGCCLCLLWSNPGTKVNKFEENANGHWCQKSSSHAAVSQRNTPGVSKS